MVDKPIFTFSLGFRCGVLDPAACISGIKLPSGLSLECTLRLLDQPCGNELGKFGKKNTNEHILILAPTNWYQIRQTNLWWNSEIQSIEYGFSKNRVAQLNKNGMCTIQDLWDDSAH